MYRMGATESCVYERAKCCQYGGFFVITENFTVFYWSEMHKKHDISEQSDILEVFVSSV